MRTTVIPAQITTVEDKIAGNLSLTQIVLLMIPVLWGTLVYTLFPPSMQIAWYKFLLVLIVSIVSMALAIRIKGKVVLQWLAILMKFNLRPKYYLYNKNDKHLRQIDLPVFENTKKITKKAPAKQENSAISSVGIKDLIQLDQFITNPNYSFTLKSGKKGGLNVALEQIQK